MNKSWWYVIAFVVIVLVLMFVFRDDVGFGPREKNIEKKFEIGKKQSAEEIIMNFKNSEGNIYDWVEFVENG